MKTLFLQNTKSPASVFMGHICNIIKLNVDKPKWLFQPFETPINIEMKYEVTTA